MQRTEAVTAKENGILQDAVRETSETPVPNSVIPADTGTHKGTLLGIVDNSSIACDALILVKIEYRDTSLYSKLIELHTSR